MIIRLKDILRGPRHLDFTLAPDWWTGTVDENDQIVGFDGALHVEMTITKETNKLAVTGRLMGKLRLRCDRCLGLYGHGLHSEFRLFLTHPPSDQAESDIELSQEDMSLRFISGDDIDIDDIIREQVYLSLPLKSLCREDCHGLCTVCGTNLNEGTCHCRGEKGHPAFLKLEKLELKTH